MEKEILMISACLLGIACRYDGKSVNALDCHALMQKYYLVPICPEQCGGLPTPRIPAERVGSLILMRDGKDVTKEFYRGAQETLRLATMLGCKKALLKENSPSCGNGTIYDGTFSGRKINGFGVTAELFCANGISVIGESQWTSLL